MRALRIVTLLAVAFSFALAWAQDEEPEIVIARDSPPDAAGFTLSQVAAGFRRPLFVTHAGDGSNRVFLVEQVGKIWILKDGLLQEQPFLDVENIISQGALTQPFSEQGLLGLAFHPDYRLNGTFYINYTDRNGSTVVERYQVDEDNADSAVASSGQILFQESQP